MNLEDRLRSHLHSGDDLFVEGSRSAGDISALGARRARRNQIGGAVAGGVIALGLVAGAVSITRGGSADGEFAADGASTEESVTAETVEESLASAAADGELDAGRDLHETTGADEAFAPLDEDGDDHAHDSELFDGPVPPFETVVGVANSFAGLRDTDGTITAITSDDGRVWRERPTSGIVEGAMFIELTHDDGSYATIFTRFENGQELWIGTSPDLENWTLVPIEGVDGREVFISSVAVRDGRIFAPGVAFDEQAESEEDFISEPRLYVGPAGGPYKLLPLPVENPGTMFSSQDALFLGGFEGLLRSVDEGVTWQQVEGATGDDFSTYTGTDGLILALDWDGVVSESIDGGESWAVADLPVETGPNSSIVFVEGPDAVAIFATTFDVDGERTAMTTMVRTDGEWVAIDVTDRVPAGVFASPVALSSEELIVQIFRDTPGPIGLPEYIRIALR